MLLFARLQMQIHPRRHFGNGAFAEKEFHKFAVLIHQIHNIRMIDRVICGAILQRNFLGIDLKGRLGLDQGNRKSRNRPYAAYPTRLPA